MEEVIRRAELDAEIERLPPLDQILNIDLQGRDPDAGATVVPYEKGALLLKTLELAVGRRRFDEFLTAYFKQFAFQSITTEEAIEFIERQLGPHTPDIARTLHEWVSEPGLPASAPRAHSQALAAVAMASRQWHAGSKSIQDVKPDDWSAQEMLHFLESLPMDLGATRMAELDHRAQLTSSSNSEILQRWLAMAVRNRYEPAYGALERFLLTVGRRKYLKPLYGELVKSEENRQRAAAIYAKARPHYHPITQALIDEIVGFRAASALQA
jgi:aminopeptidase N